ncbi:hypothetical protein D9M73_138060 [compost metagenome]
MPSILNCTVCSPTVYPAFSTAARNAFRATPLSARTVAASVARFTFASLTPGIAERAFSTRLTQDAQVIPSTGKVQSVLPDALGWSAVAVFTVFLICF